MTQPTGPNLGGTADDRPTFADGDAEFDFSDFRPPAPPAPPAPPPPPTGSDLTRTIEQAMSTMPAPGAGGDTGGDTGPADETLPEDRPVGQGDWVVGAGDCMSSIAKQSGHFWETLWNLGENAELKRVRKNPNTLRPGDLVTVPPIRIKYDPGATAMRHNFRLKGEPSKLRLRILKPERWKQTQGGPPPDHEGLLCTDGDADAKPEPIEPMADTPYILDIDGKITRGRTDGDGKLELSIPGDARSGKLTLAPGTPDELKIPLQLGVLAPYDTILGIRQRLVNLAYACAPGGEDMTEDLEAAILLFQARFKLQRTGEPDGPTRDKVKEVHGS
jgi:N-acetylmuramoyl-L-alanine amidase